MTEHTVALVVTSSTPLWYATRATGLTALVLLTASMALGLLSSVRFARPGWPRFVTLGLHRNVSLLALAFTVAHVLTSVLDGFVNIPVQDAVIPFISSYRPLWTGLGAIAFDLMIALAVTSLLRTRMTYRGWRLVHSTSYLCWPVAVVHGLGTGTDTQARWVLALTGACVAVVAGLILWRLARGWSARPLASAGAAAAVILLLIAGGAWLTSGPLAHGWARRAGTPATTASRPAASRPAAAREPEASR
jgi:DMSO/TMAO reductase YedYZ heme-binding membrane subunit